MITWVQSLILFILLAASIGASLMGQDYIADALLWIDVGFLYGMVVTVVLGADK